MRFGAGVLYPAGAFFGHAYPAAHHLEMAVMIGLRGGEGGGKVHPQAVVSGPVLDLRLDIQARHAQSQGHAAGDGHLDQLGGPADPVGGEAGREAQAAGDL